jgi:hypothetical protein
VTATQIGIPGDNAQLTLPLQDLVFNQKRVVGSIVGGRSGKEGRGGAREGVSPGLQGNQSSVAGRQRGLVPQDSAMVALTWR